MARLLEFQGTHHLIDALPYVDGITAETNAQVERLIAEEMERSEKKPKDYLNKMPPIAQPKFGGSEILQNEFKRVKSAQPMPSLDTKRYALSSPDVDKQNDPEEWKKCIKRAQAQIEHQLIKVINLELALKYGPEAWKRLNAQMSQLDSEYQQELQSVKQQITEINRKRKLSQTVVGEQLQKLEAEWYKLLTKNSEIIQECHKRRRRIESLKSKDA